MKAKILFSLLTLSLFTSCKVETTIIPPTDIQEGAQQVGDVMASMDEAGGASGSIASIQNSIRGDFNRYAPGALHENYIASLLLPKAEATSCFGNGFTGCDGSGHNVRTFNGCTVGSAIFSGDVTLNFSQSNCTIAGSGQSVTRIPNFTVTGRRGATLAVTKTGSVGQKLTFVTGSGTSRVFAFSNDGIRRIFSLNSSTLFDFTTVTSGDITVTGTDRTNRVLSGGSLVVTNNLNSVTCSYVPTNVTWSRSTCNCPVSGSWAGSCSDGKSLTLDITGCGTANFSLGSDTEAVTFDRCSGT